MGVEVPELDLPSIEAGEHLVEYLFEAGPTSAGEVLTYGEIAAWTRLTGTVLTSWEAKTLRGMSREYLSELHAATAKDRPPPSREAAEP
jgi:hypothetical protein